MFTYELDDAYFAGLESDLVLGGGINAEVVCTKRGDLYQLHIALEGYVDVQCDRCLDEVDLYTESERDLIVKLGPEYLEESDEVLIIPEREGVLDLQWLLYEDIVLSLPMQRMHDEGECNGAMMELYSSMATDEVHEGGDQEPSGDTVRDDDGIDQRWAALKKLREINN